VPNRSLRLLWVATFLTLVGIASAASDQSDDKWIIPPGREELLGKILGVGTELPGGCHLVKGDIQFSVVNATYDCDGSQVVVQFAHPDQAGPAPAVTTKRFAIRSESGTAPPDLLAGLEERARAQEGPFAWEEAPPSGPLQESQFGSLIPEGPMRYVVAAAALLAIGALGFILRKA
jgi:hypothetical protein